MNQQNPAGSPELPTVPPAPQPTLEERLAVAEARAEAADAKLAETAEQMIALIKDTADPDAVVRYAVYDTVYERYLGPVFDRKPTKAQVVALIKLDASAVDDVADLEIREV